MPTIYYLSNTAADLTGGADFSYYLESSSSAAANAAISIAGSATEVSYGFTRAGVPGAGGGSGSRSWTAEINVTTANNKISCSVIFNRINSAGTVQASSAASAAAAANAGVQTHTVTADLGVFAAGDRLRVDYRFANGNTMAQSLGLGFNTNASEVTAPWDSPPSAPTLTATGKVAEIDLSWNDASNETSYEVERSADGSTGWTQQVVLAANVTQWTDIEVVPGATWYYRVRGVNAAGNGAYSNTASAAAKWAGASDNFSRTVASGWGTADLGGAWTVSDAASASTNGSLGQITLSTIVTRTHYLPNVEAQDVLASATISPSTTDGQVQHRILVRKQGSATTAYEGELTFADNGGAVTLNIKRRDSGGVSTTINASAASIASSFAAGDVFHIKIQASGINPTVLRAKAWKSTSPEPSTWSLGNDGALTDSTGPQLAGAVGIVTSTGTGFGTSTVFSWDVFNADVPPPAAGTTDVEATKETAPVGGGGDAADDVAIWPNTTTPSKSLVIGTDKVAGKLHTYKLDETGASASVYQTVTPPNSGQPNNVDLRTNFTINGAVTTIVAISEKTSNRIGLYTMTVDANGYGTLTDVTGATGTTLDYEPYGLCCYYDGSLATPKHYVFVTTRNEAGTAGEYKVHQYELQLAGTSPNQTVNLALVRTISYRPSADGTGTVALTLCEGLVADDYHHVVYVAEERIALQRYGAHAADGHTGVSVDNSTANGGTRLLSDIEGLTIADLGTGTGYLIACGQNGSNMSRFEVYDRTFAAGAANSHIKSFRVKSGSSVDAVEGCDGIDIFKGNLGTNYPNGAFVAQDETNTGANQNFKIVPYEAIFPASDPPGAPSASAATNVANTSFSANWSAGAGGAPTSYRLDVATDSAFTAFVTGYNDLNVGNVTTYSVTGLTANTAYYYRVRAVNASGTSASSNTVSVTTTNTAVADITFVGASTNQSSTAVASLAITCPPGTTTNDVMDAAITVLDGNNAITAPNGWTLTDSISTGTSTTADVVHARYRRVATADDVAGTTSYTWSFSVSNTCGGGIDSYRGVDTANPSAATPTKAKIAAATSLTVGAVTTAVDKSLVVGSAGSYSGTSATHTPPTGMTERFETTGRITSMSDVVQATAGSSGDKTWTFGASTQHAGILWALRPSGSGGGATGAALKWMAAGAPSSGGAVITVKTDAASSDVKIRYSTDATFATFTDTAAQATESGNYYYTKFALTGLTADTVYYYRAVIGGTVNTTTGQFKTFPASGAWSGTIAFASCRELKSTNAVYGRIKARTPQLWLDMGDLFYGTEPITAESSYHDYYDQSLGVAQQNDLYRSCYLAYMADDHDGGNNNRDGTFTSEAVFMAAYRKAIPHPELAKYDTNADGTPDTPIADHTDVAQRALGHSFVVGRVRVIVADSRTASSSNTATDDSSKTKLGAAQKQWFKDEITAAKNAGQAVVFISTMPWIASSSGDDDWGSFSTERKELADHIIAQGMMGRIVAIGGDAHMLAYDDGTNNKFGTSQTANGFPVYQAAALDRAGSTKGGPYSGGTYSTNTGDGKTHSYGTLTVTDTGGSTVTILFEGWRDNAGADLLWGSHTATLTVSAAVTHALDGSSAGTSSAGATGLQLSHALAGATDGTSAATAASLRLDHALAGAADGTSTAAATQIVVGHALGATSDGTSATSADLTVGAATGLEGSSAGTSVAGADGLTLSHPLAASSAGTSTTAATTLTLAHPLTGTSAGTSTAAGSSIQVGHPLTATVTGTSSTTANLSLGQGLEGLSTGTSTVAASGLSLQQPLAGTSTGTSAAAGTAIVVGHPLVGTADGTSTSGAALRMGHALAGAAAGTSGVVGEFAALVPPLDYPLSAVIGTANGRSAVVRANQRSVTIG